MRKFIYGLFTSIFASMWQFKTALLAMWVLSFLPALMPFFENGFFHFPMSTMLGLDSLNEYMFIGMVFILLLLGSIEMSFTTMEDEKSFDSLEGIKGFDMGFCMVEFVYEQQENGYIFMKMYPKENVYFDNMFLMQSFMKMLLSLFVFMFIYKYFSYIDNVELFALLGATVKNDINMKKFKFKLPTHSFHMVDPSPWPFQVSLALFQMLFGFTLYLHFYEKGFFIFIGSFLALMLGTSFWWSDIVSEGTFEGRHTFAVQHGLRFGMVLFMVSEIMLFFAFFWAYFHSSLNPSPAIGGIWPGQYIQLMDPFLMPGLNTMLLLTSGAALTWAHSALMGGYSLEAMSGLLFTMTLATMFTLFQMYEYFNAPFDMTDGMYGSTFYMLTGLHGFHVMVGTMFLSVALYSLVQHHYTVTNHMGFESAAWYWHFVDVVWMFLFLAMYMWGQGEYYDPRGL